MVNPVWPSELPKPKREGWRLGWDDARTERRRSAPASGWSLNYSQTTQPMTLVLDLTRDQLAVLDRFYRNDIKLGSLIFEMPDPITDGWPLLTDAGEQLIDPIHGDLLISATLLMQWGDQPPEKSIVGLRFRVVCPMRIMP